jgi:hypothetical protein
MTVPPVMSILEKEARPERRDLTTSFREGLTGRSARHNRPSWKISPSTPCLPVAPKKQVFAMI